MLPAPRPLRIAIVHDYLTQRGGAERVVLAMLRCFPGATLYTTIYNPATTYADFARYDIRTSWLDRVGAFRRDPRRALPFLAGAIASLEIDDADVVLTSTSGWAHGIRSSAPVVAYCHTPARWLYEPADYFQGAPSVLAASFRAVRPMFRRWDTTAAARVATYVANSTTVAGRIERAYGVDARVVFPPSTLLDDLPAEEVPGVEPGFFLTIARRRAYKNVDRICEAVEEHPAGRLVVVGDLPPRPDGRPWSDRIASLPSVSDAQLRWLYSSCRALVAMSHEDFGLTPVEAFTFGAPVVALAAGGYLDSCIDDVTGVLVPNVETTAIADGLRRVEERVWDSERIRLHAKTFHLDAFAEEMHRVLLDAVGPVGVADPPRLPARTA